MLILYYLPWLRSFVSLKKKYLQDTYSKKIWQKSFWYHFPIYSTLVQSRYLQMMVMLKSCTCFVGMAIFKYFWWHFLIYSNLVQSHCLKMIVMLKSCAYFISIAIFSTFYGNVQYSLKLSSTGLVFYIIAENIKS